MLTLCFVPFLVALRFFVIYQTMLHMTRFALRDNVPLYAFARRSILTACGLNLGKAQLFETEFRARLLLANSRQDVDRVMQAFLPAWTHGRRVRSSPGTNRISEVTPVLAPARRKHVRVLVRVVS